MKTTRRILAALLASCMMSTCTLGTAVTASAETSVSTTATDNKPVVKAKVYEDHIIFSWKKVPGATKYKLYTYYDGKLKKLAETKERVFYLDGPVPGAKYSIAVKAYIDGKWTKITKKDIVTATAAAVNGDKMLSLWTKDAKAKTELISYMKAITTEGSKDYIPLGNRIAVFDFDGTLFCETDQGIFQSALLQYRILEDPEYKDKASELERKVANAMKSANKESAGPEALADLDKSDMEKAGASAFAGMTLEEYNECIQRFKQQPMDSYDGMLRGESFYRPMLQIIDYLTANGFTVYIVSGAGRYLVRDILYNSMLYIPDENVIGTDMVLAATGQNGTEGAEYLFTSSDKLVLTGESGPINIGLNKVTAIAENIGKKPVLSFGNSSGDSSMNTYTITNNKYRSLAFMLCCDDTVR
ncbi:MAG: haloacid dehalogenase-like hydrolase, partial [Ruminiclostridium sp.]|nr:haloacid dehalogenase-like hydrolase [Ruminiclostridium sp.]